MSRRNSTHLAVDKRQREFAALQLKCELPEQHPSPSLKRQHVGRIGRRELLEIIGVGNDAWRDAVLGGDRLQ